MPEAKSRTRAAGRGAAHVHRLGRRHAVGSCPRHRRADAGHPLRLPRRDPLQLDRRLLHPRPRCRRGHPRPGRRRRGRDAEHRHRLRSSSASRPPRRATRLGSSASSPATRSTRSSSASRSPRSSTRSWSAPRSRSTTCRLERRGGSAARAHQLRDPASLRRLHLRGDAGRDPGRAASCGEPSRELRAATAQAAAAAAPRRADDVAWRR